MHKSMEMPKLSLPNPTGAAVEWAVATQLVPYEQAVSFMEDRIAAIASGEAAEMVWLLEHPPLYTAGTSAQSQDLITPDRFPVYQSGRGGQYTYHGPGQRVAYAMLDLRARGRDVRRFVRALEEWIILALARLGVAGKVSDERIGVWVERAALGEPVQSGAVYEDKIAAIGIRLRRWVSFHGISLNVCPDLSHFDGIVPCGITEHGVTSLEKLGVPCTMGEVDSALRAAFAEIFEL